MNTVRSFTADDVALGMRLKAAANWNQTEADWRRTLELEPTGCFVGVCDGVDAATLTTAVFGDVAWIAMVLTDPAFRGRGLATTLMRHALEYLEARGVRSMRLDATALGKPVYEKFGFRVVSEEARFFGTPSATIPTAADASDIRSMTTEHLAAITAIDAAATGNERGRLLELERRDWLEAAFVMERSSEIGGFVMARRGSRATQIGPCIAVDAPCGERLLASGLSQLRAAPVYVDVPTANSPAVELVRRFGLDVERTFFRMTHGVDVHENESAIWANYGPELG